MHDYPNAAIREALINAIVHRDYNASGADLNIKCFTDRMEFISPGGIFGNTGLGEIRSGFSSCRNPALAHVFFILNFIESYSTGIPRIFEEYKGAKRQPKIKLTKNVFRMTLPNLNFGVTYDSLPGVRPPEEYIMRTVKMQGSINRLQVQQLLGISQTASGLILRKLAERGKLIREGSSRNMRYIAGRN
ncbi:MAG: hypothetical protein LBR80_09940 [Deltaproteobacteria bacterium]|jgi:ATP-dependent DNA helicase RecG|nr:hypothetical protein [Deltaproteobacteria bacterium]